MKYLLTSLFWVCAFASNADTTQRKDNVMKARMIINGQPFEVRIHDNPAAKSFVNTLPLQLEMTELNGNEKFAELPHSLPSSPVQPGTLHAGDLMLYGTQTLVLFYASFDSSYRYTPIGNVVNPGTLPAMGDTDKIEVEFSRQ